MDSQGRRDDEPLCTGAGGHRLEDTATRRFFRLMFPEVRAHFESPRQEEHRSTPAGMRTLTLSSDVVPPVGRQDQGSHERLFPISMSHLGSSSRPWRIVDLTTEVNWQFGISVRMRTND